MCNKPQCVGHISLQVAALLNLSPEAGKAILIGETNIAHMQSRHSEDYERYGEYIPEILSSPDYVGLNAADGSIEYIKEFRIDNTFVKVAIRVTQPKPRL